MNTISDITYFLLKDRNWENPKSLEELGYIFFGPIVFNYFYWLTTELQYSDLILFNSREGYFLNEIYQIFKIKYNLPKSVYFKTSRTLASISSFQTEADIYNSFNLHRYEGRLSQLLKYRFRIDTVIKDDIEVNTNNKIPDLSLYITDILNKSKYVKLKYGKYIYQLIDNANNIYMIDSGYQGSTQYYLQKAFNLNFNGRYMTYSGNLSLKNTKGFYDFENSNFKKNIIFFESVFTDIVGTFVDINDNGFVNEHPSENQKYFNKKIEIINGVKQFIYDILSFNITDVEIPQKMADDIFNLMCMNDYIKTQSLFDTFFHDNLYVRTTIKKIEIK
jgi:hypothetical protein